MVNIRGGGRDYNYFQKFSITNSDFDGYHYDGYHLGDETNPMQVEGEVFIKFSAVGLKLINEGSGSSNVIEYSFNGETLHGELDPTITDSKSKTFYYRRENRIFFRVKAGSTGPIMVSVEAWGEK